MRINPDGTLSVGEEIRASTVGGNTSVGYGPVRLTTSNVTPWGEETGEGPYRDTELRGTSNYV